jgi:DNA polymerase-3 subunit beta
MELTAPLDAFKAALEVSRFTTTSGASALAGVHLSVSKNSATFTGYNGEQSARTSMPVKATADSELLLSRPTVEYINALPANAQLKINVSSDSLKITCGALSATMRLEPATNYPRIPFPSTAGVALSASSLRNGLREVRASAAAPTSSRASLAGVLFEVVNGELRLVATDSFRLALNTIANSSLPEGTRFTLPIKAVAELERALARSEEVSVTVSDNNVCFETGSLKLSSHLIADKFPTYGPIIPAIEAPGMVEASADEMLEAVKRLKIVASNENRAVRVSCTEGVVSIATQSPIGDKVVEPLGASVSGTVPEFAVHVDNLAAAVQSLGSDKVRISIHEALKPILITRPGDETSKQVVMPIRV